MNLNANSPKAKGKTMFSDEAGVTGPNLLKQEMDSPFKIPNEDLEKVDDSKGSFIRLVGVCPDVDYKVSIQGVIDRNLNFIGNLKRINAGAKSLIPDKMLNLSLLGSNCKVTIEITE